MKNNLSHGSELQGSTDPGPFRNYAAVQILAPLTGATRHQGIVALKARICRPSGGHSLSHPALSHPALSHPALSHPALSHPAGAFNPALISVLLEEFGGDYGVVGAGAKMVAQVLPARPFSYYPDPVETADGHELILVEGEVDLTRYLAAPPGAAKTVVLSLRIEEQGHFSISQPIILTFVPGETAAQTYGGLDSNGGIVESEFFEVHGWALKAGDPLKSAAIKINGKGAGAARIGISSPKKAAALPDVEGSDQCRFSLTLYRREFENLTQPLTVSAELEFVSGGRLNLIGYPLTWLPAKAERTLCAIESAACDHKGCVIVRGWCRSAEPPKLFWSLAQESFELGSSSAPGSSIEWEHRSDLDARFPNRIQHGLWGFTARVAPGYFVYRGEQVRMYLQAGKETLELGTPDDWNKLTAVVKSLLIAAPGLRTALRQAKAAALRGLSSSSVPASIPPAPAGDIRAPKSAAPSGFPSRIMFASHNLRATEGAPKIIFEIVRACSIESRRARPAPEILVIAGDDGELNREYRALGASVLVLPQLHAAAPNWEVFCRQYHQAYTAVRAFAPEFVYANTGDAFWGAALAKETGVPCLWGIHESVAPLAWQPEWAAPFRMQFLHALLEADHFLFTARATQALFENLGIAQRSTLIPNGIDLNAIDLRRKKTEKAAARQALGVPEQTRVVSVIGTTAYRKGQDVFLSEMRLLCDSAPHERFKFFLVGARELPYLSELKQLTAQLGLADKVEFVPEQPEISAYFIASDVICIPSREESSPLVALEAFAYEVPLVSTLAFGLAEQVTDGVNAMCFSIERPGELALAVERLLNDRELALRLARAGRSTVEEQFSIELNTSRHLELISRVYSS